MIENPILIAVVLFMALVTYIPRMLPLVLLNRLQLPPFIRRQFQFIPYAVLGALIFPGVLDSTGNPITAAAGGIAAVVLALVGANLLFVVLGSIGAVLLADLLV
jgi:branched-subunit amino acid transport protein